MGILNILGVMRNIYVEQEYFKVYLKSHIIYIFQLLLLLYKF